ncbi:MAG TPA: hypothetical protein VJS12_12020 [Steroidobacteraceae bacterium]|nr:hypothetical protein [Steroidobacteraceae bacterium]
MNRAHLGRLFSRLAVVCFAAAAISAMASATDKAEAVKSVEGLWAYTALQPGGKGESMPLHGVILFKDGVFAQQSIFDGEPFATQGAMAHAGPYGSGPMGVHLVAEQTISIAPEKPAPLSFRPSTLHDISVDRSGDTMKIVFDSGTVQTFKRIGPGKGQIHKLEKGVFALVDGHFVLVDGDEKGVVSGYGTYKNSGTSYDLNVERWAESTPGKAINKRDFAAKATFDGKTLKLADGRSFAVVAGK